MRKTDKKIDNQLRLGLTDVCEAALKDISGFQWLTHTVNYANFPQSLTLVCVFKNNDQLSAFLESGHKKLLTTLIDNKLKDIGINLTQITHHLKYDSEENCTNMINCNWAHRLR